MDSYLKQVRFIWFELFLIMYILQQALVRASYHGQQHLEGNKSLVFLKRLDDLEQELQKVESAYKLY